jgi:predicted DNA-binding transcriptional regulator AlpA
VHPATYSQRRSHDPADAQPDVCLRWPEVQPLVGVSRTTWWRMIKRHEAPAPIQLSPNCVGWRMGDIAAHQAARSAIPEAA